MITAYWAFQRFGEYLDDSARNPEFRFKESDLAEAKHVADYVYYWIAYGGGAADCGADFGIFLTTFALIAQEWLDRPNIYPHGQNPRPVKIVDKNCSWCQRAFDPQFFKLMAHNPNYFNDTIRSAEES